MRSIFAGIEYAGKSTLVKLLADYYHQRKNSDSRRRPFYHTGCLPEPRITRVNGRFSERCERADATYADPVSR